MDDALLDNFSNLRRLPSPDMRSGEMFLSDRVLSGRFSLCPSRSWSGRRAGTIQACTRLARGVSSCLPDSFGCVFLDHEITELSGRRQSKYSESWRPRGRRWGACALGGGVPRDDEGRPGGWWRAIPWWSRGAKRGWSGWLPGVDDRARFNSAREEQLKLW